MDCMLYFEGCLLLSWKNLGGWTVSWGTYKSTQQAMQCSCPTQAALNNPIFSFDGMQALPPKPFPKLPASVLRDYAPGGPLFVIAQVGDPAGSWAGRPRPVVRLHCEAAFFLRRQSSDAQ